MARRRPAAGLYSARMPRALLCGQNSLPTEKDFAAMHYRLRIWLCLLTLLATSVGSLYAQTPAPAANSTVFVPLILKLGGSSGGGGMTHTGEATYYNEADGGGNCS